MLRLAGVEWAVFCCLLVQIAHTGTPGRLLCVRVTAAGLLRHRVCLPPDPAAARTQLCSRFGLAAHSCPELPQLPLGASRWQLLPLFPPIDQPQLMQRGPLRLYEPIERRESGTSYQVPLTVREADDLPELLTTFCGVHHTATPACNKLLLQLREKLQVAPHTQQPTAEQCQGAVQPLWINPAAEDPMTGWMIAAQLKIDSTTPCAIRWLCVSLTSHHPAAQELGYCFHNVVSGAVWQGALKHLPDGRWTLRVLDGPQTVGGSEVTFQVGCQQGSVKVLVAVGVTGGSAPVGVIGGSVAVGVIGSSECISVSVRVCV